MANRSNDNVWAVFRTDVWHSHDSRALLGVAESIESAIACVNGDLASNGEPPLSEEQAGLMRKIHQTQSADEFEGEYLAERFTVWKDE
jgi:hypothetical protein